MAVTRVASAKSDFAILAARNAIYTWQIEHDPNLGLDLLEIHPFRDRLRRLRFRRSKYPAGPGSLVVDLRFL